jgi:hypothetical protein
MNSSFDTVKKTHIENIEHLLLILESYNKYAKMHIDVWDDSKYNELKMINDEMDNLIESFFTFVNDE